MIIVLSPSKTLDFANKKIGEHTIPDCLDNSLQLINNLRKLSVKQIGSLMSISEKLAELNYQRYQDFVTPFTIENSNQALYAFKGDVYDGLQAESFGKADVGYAQEHLRIISGLYGLLRPLDLIQPYRLEMGIKLAHKNNKDLYQFWGDKITNKLNDSMQSQLEPVLVNLASAEYFKAVNTKLLQGKIITPIFKENKAGSYKIIGLFAKKARGMMARYIIKNQLKNIEDIKNFCENGYSFNAKLSSETDWVFLR